MPRGIYPRKPRLKKRKARKLRKSRVKAIAERDSLGIILEIADLLRLLGALHIGGN